jgi:sigma-B regulation protein RsbU (phosphoserine phosphatase)
VLASRLDGAEVSSGTLLSLLNHQLYQSTPAEKYATLFLGVYDGERRQLTYSNGGHLPPIILAEDGSLRRLELGGTVVGLFDHRSYEESSVPLRRGPLAVKFGLGDRHPGRREHDYERSGESDDVAGGAPRDFSCLLAKGSLRDSEKLRKPSAIRACRASASADARGVT